MKTLLELRKNLKSAPDDHVSLDLALLGDSATQHLGQAIRGAGHEFGLNINLWESDYDQIDLQVFSANSDLYQSDRDAVMIFQSSEKLLKEFNKAKFEERSSFAELVLGRAKDLVRSIRSRMSSNILFCNFVEINDEVFGNYSNKVPDSFIFQLRRLNLALMEYAQECPELHIIDLSTIQNQMGRDAFFHSSIYINADMVLSLDAIPRVAMRVAGVLAAFKGFFKKCVIIDLDNTTWGGIIGDDGIEQIQIGSLGIGKAFTEFQYWIKKLKQRGIIVAVCSKNTDAIAKEPFEDHPDMVLSLEDISVFVANWENKADNIRMIQKVLNIGFDSMVFLDDNPYEREVVRESLPAVCVPDLPEDPAEYLNALYALNLFETVSSSQEDRGRTKLYQLESKRVELKKDFANEEEFLANLEMVAEVKPFDKFSFARIAQLSQRSNQFNLRTVRYTQPEVETIATSDSFLTLQLSLKDRLGDHGLVAVVIGEKDGDSLFIDTWLMSCRVLKRGMENFTLNCLAEAASLQGAKWLHGEYLPTPKNAIVADHYEDLDFESTGEKWTLSLETFQPRSTQINKK